jgi:hypothetical protein
VVLEKEREIIWTDRVRNEKVLHRVKKERNILHTIKDEGPFGLVTCCVGSLLKLNTEGKIVEGIEVTGRQ